MSLTLGATELPLPERDGITVNRKSFGVTERMYSGALRADLPSDPKAEISVRWVLLSLAEYETVSAAWQDGLTQVQTLTLPNGDEYQVLAALAGLQETQIYDIADVAWYNVSARFDEV
jgi:hypothetical protein